MLIKMLDLSTDADGIADFLICLSDLEQKNSQLFKILSEKTTMSSAQPLLLEIAQATKHTQNNFKK